MITDKELFFVTWNHIIARKLFLIDWNIEDRVMILVKNWEVIKISVMNSPLRTNIALVSSTSFVVGSLGI